ncbi:hypothetical protein J2T50_000121 [Streptococcus gallinaceus]|uniref:hypothetical protein n=1 Tax=Streptococcus gallinaceus TaxID=165758 RepID=UPI00209FB158|nr:hypothetical protein [Streptococcus gallinaceus]MCP1638428.1 hypothetical protein [Streptococcus gallinaceus]MCP1769485.1 hypothetical protein [Streptococcus gallinaceus]
MRESQKTNQEILDDLLSKNEHLMWSGACALNSLSQNPNRVKFFIPYLEKIKSLKLSGGLLLPSQRFIDRAVKLIEFQRDSPELCSCRFLPEEIEFDPEQLEAGGYVRITKRARGLGDTYLVECLRCHQWYEVVMNEYHALWWKWSPIEKGD